MPNVDTSNQPIAEGVPNKPAPRRHGFFAKNLRDDAEKEEWRTITEGLFKEFPHLAESFSDQLIVEKYAEQLVLSGRMQPEPLGTRVDGRAYETGIARSKLALKFAEALGITRRQRQDKDENTAMEKFMAIMGVDPADIAGQMDGRKRAARKAADNPIRP